ncbi:MAG: APC family permease [Polyangiaceae bacterium]
MKRRRDLGLVGLVAATYFMVSGGPYGLEEIVAGGYRAAFFALIVTPLVWSLPTALMVGELASALPEEGGYYVWVRRALGPFWGFQEAWLSLAASVFDMAIYPTLVMLYAGRLPGAPRWASSQPVGVLVVVASAVWNLRGARSVGRGSIALGVALLCPFALFAVLALAHAPLSLSGSLSAARAAQPRDLLLGLLGTAPSAPSPGLPEPKIASSIGAILVTMWNYMGWDNASTIAREVDRPSRTYPRAVLWTLAIVVISYLVPVAAAAVAGIDPSGWTTGAWVGAARQVGGRGLALAVVVGGMVCGAGMFNALLLSYSRLPAVLAEDGWLPSFFAAPRGSARAPAISIAVCAVAYATALGLGFDRLVELDVVFYGASLLLEFVALVVLRVREPHLARPFRVPGGPWGLALTSLPPVALLGLAVWTSRDDRVGPLTFPVFAAIVVAAGAILYAVRRRPTPA